MGITNTKPPHKDKHTNNKDIFMDTKIKENRDVGRVMVTINKNNQGYEQLNLWIKKHSRIQKNKHILKYTNNKDILKTL